MARGQDAAAREYLVQFQGPVQESWKSAVIAAGATLLEYVPDFAFRVRLRPRDAAAVRRLEFVSWLRPYSAGFKLPPSAGGTAERLFLVRVDPDADADAALAALASAGYRVARTGRSLLLLTARSDQLAAVAQVVGVASIEPYAIRVKHNEYGGGVILGSRFANDNGYDGSSQAVAVADTGLGTGTAGGAHADLLPARVRAIFNRPGVPDFCFETIVDDGAADVDTGHGTHVATAVLGGGDAAGVGRGSAPAASLVFQAIENYAVPSLFCSVLYGVTEGYYLVGLPADFGDLYQQAYSAGARIHSDSWGSAAAGAYTADAENTDAFVWAHRDMTIVFSAGNDGVDADADGRIDAGSVGSPATGKNVIAVGASENDRFGNWPCDTTLSYTTCAEQGGQNTIFTYGATWPDAFPAPPLRDDPSAGNAEQMAAFSSRGPTSDGRIKPDVVAPGTWTLSGYSDLYQQQYDAAPNAQTGRFQYDGWGAPVDSVHKYLGGTSMAAPLVAGGAAVVRDFYQKAHGLQASAALVKATLVNTAVDLLDENNDGALDNAFPIPNVHEGWGRVDLATATNGRQRFSDEAAPLATGATATFTFPVVEPGRPFKATLVWTDYPSSPTAAANLVNDLDLTVVGPDGTTYLGNAFSSGWSAVGGSPDRVNNVENVFIPAATSGTWTVLVSGYNVPMGPQSFALVVGDGPASDRLPVVRVSVDDGTATEAGSSAGVLRVTRTGDTSTSLTVHYTVSGTASAGIDFEPLSGSVVIPEGAPDAVVHVVPIDDALVETGEWVTVTLSASAAYTVGSPASGTVAIVSDDLPPDLVVTQVNGPSTAAAGSAITVSDTTKNQGTAPAPASETGFYLSANYAVDGSDVFLGSRVVGTLAAGASEASTSTFLVPESTPPGAYYVLAKADWTDEVPETNEANNTRSGSNLRVGPDLIVSAVMVPSTAAPGTTVLVGDTTRNQGAGSASASVTGFFLSANASWEASDLRLGSRGVTALVGGASSTASTALTIPASIAPGTYYVIVKADADEAVAESTENNNTRTATVRVGADLVVAALTAPAAAAAGERISVSETTQNTGGADAPASKTSFSLSMNTSVDASDVPIGSRDVPPLADGASSAATVPLTIPAATPAGTYYIVAAADALGEVAETSEANNQRASSVVRIGPDLIVSALTAPATAEAGAAITVTESVKNQGGATSAGTESALYLSTNGSLDVGDVELGRRVVPSLPPGASDSASRSLVLPASLAPGSYYVLSLVDPGLLVPESTETNNARTSGVVRVGPDLVVSALTGPAAVVRGGAIVVTDTTRNQGGGAADPSITRLYLSRDGTVDPSDVLLGARVVGALAAGVSSQSATSLVIPAGTAPGTYYVVARADDEGAVAETSESNNMRATRLRVDP